MSSAAIIRSKLRRLEKEIEEFERDYSPAGISRRFAEYGKDFMSYQNQGYSYFREDLITEMTNIRLAIENRRTQLDQSMDYNIRRLMNEVRQASFFANLDSESESVLERAEEELDDAERKLKAARRNYIESLDPLADVEKRAKKLLKRIPYYLEMRDEASFQFHRGEEVVMADKAEWVVTGKGKEDPDGILFLTNQRLIFEQKEKTGKKFGLFGGKMEHGVQWAYPLDQIESVSFEDQGMLGRKDMLMLQMKAGAEHDEITLESKGDDDNSEWHDGIVKAMNSELIR